MAASTSCPNCTSSAVRYSQPRLRDGLRRLLFYSAFRCHGCGYRHFRFSPWSLAATLAVLLLVAFVSGVVYVLSTDLGSSAGLPHASAPETIHPR